MTAGRGRRPGECVIIEDDATTLEFFEQMLVERGIHRRAVSTVRGRPRGGGELPLPTPCSWISISRSRTAWNASGVCAPPRCTLTMPVAILTGDYFLDEDVARELAGSSARGSISSLCGTDDLHQIVEATRDSARGSGAMTIRRAGLVSAVAAAGAHPGAARVDRGGVYVDGLPRDASRPASGRR